MSFLNPNLVIIPTYNEAQNILKMLSQFINSQFDVLIIDDNSPDKTYELVENFIKQNNFVHLIKRDGKEGLGSAYRKGFEWAINNQYEYAIEMDADFSHSFDDLISMFNAKENFDLVIGSRYITGGSTEGWSNSRKLLSVFANKFAKKMLNSQINDMTSGFRIYSTKALEKVSFSNTESNGYSFQIEMTYLFISKGLNIKEFPITFYERNLGKSKMSKSIAFEAIQYLVKTKFIK